MCIHLCGNNIYVLLTGNWENTKVEGVICAEEFDDGLPGRQGRSGAAVRAGGGRSQGRH